MGDLLLGALALMLVVEGLLPFLSPATWREVFERAMRMSDGQIRFLGLSSMLAGLAMLLAFWPDALDRARQRGRYNAVFNPPVVSHVVCLAAARAHRRCPARRGAAHRGAAARACSTWPAATASSW